ncbi:MAG TPA: hypothetical protein VN696_01870 [Pyrinomonadaceae bacterium]|nr:hypothetical protein [Pyrinomonadaceae bacterium]
MKDEWKEKLEEFFEDRNRGLSYTRDHAREFFETTVSNAFEALKNELQKYGHNITTNSTLTSESLWVFTGGDEFAYSIDAEVYPDRVKVFAQASTAGRHALNNEREQYVGLADITEEEIIEDFLEHYFPYMQDLSVKDWRSKHRLSQTA